MLGRHVLQQGGELRVGSEPAAGQSCAGAGSWEHYRRGEGREGHWGSWEQSLAATHSRLLWRSCIGCTGHDASWGWQQMLGAGVVTWTGTIAVSRTEWIYKDRWLGSCVWKEDGGSKEMLEEAVQKAASFRP